MSDDPRAVLGSYLLAWENADVSAMEALVAPGFEHVVNGRREDRERLLERVGGSDVVLTDRRFEIDALVVDGTWVACRCRLIGKHTGVRPIAPLLSGALGLTQIEPTLRDVTMSGMILAEIEDGRLVSGYGEWDRLGLLAQVLDAGRASDPAGRDGRTWDRTNAATRRRSVTLA